MSNVKVRLDDVKQIDIVNVPGGITASELKKLHPDAEVISSLTMFVLKNRLNFVRVEDENKKDVPAIHDSLWKADSNCICGY